MSHNARQVTFQRYRMTKTSARSRMAWDISNLKDLIIKQVRTGKGLEAEDFKKGLLYRQDPEYYKKVLTKAYHQAQEILDREDESFKIIRRNNG